jgi:hypothetical protein
MKEYTCIVCGAKGLSTQDRKFCCKNCAEAHYRKTHGIAEDTRPSCLYNDGVVCYTPNCAKCGWNPEVAKKRTEASNG